MTTTHTPAQVERFRTATIAKAEQLLAQYPQYRGHWNGWRVVRIKRTITTKLGPAFKAGEWTIATLEKMDPRFFAGLPGMTPAKLEAPRVVAFSLSNRCDTWIGDDAIEWLDGAPQL